MSATDRVNVLDPMRGLASFAVCWFHLAFASRYTPDPAWWNMTGQYGYLGVQAFFVISGFVLPYALFKSRYRVRNFVRFVLKRIVRLDPPYFLTIAGTVALAYASTFVPGWKGSLDISLPQVLSHLAYLTALTGHDWIVHVFWTLGIEFQFYLCLALGFPLLVHEKAWVRRSILCVFCLLAFAFSTDGGADERPFLFQHAFVFALGITTFWRHERLADTREWLGWQVLATVGTALTLGPLFAAASVLSSLLIALLPHLTLGRVLAWLGRLSYSLYLVHLPIGLRVLGIAERLPSIPKPFGVAMAIAGSLVAAQLLYWIAEGPSQRLSSRITYKKREETFVELVPTTMP